MNQDEPNLDLWWTIPGVLAGMSIPFLHPERPHTTSATLHDFADELPALWQAGIRAIVCLLNMPGVASTYTTAGFAFHLLPLKDGVAPSAEQFQGFLHFVACQRALGHPVAVHCEEGIGPTGTVLAGYLTACGSTPEAAIAHVRSARPGAIETRRQLEFLRRLPAILKLPI